MEDAAVAMFVDFCQIILTSNFMREEEDPALIRTP